MMLSRVVYPILGIAYWQQAYEKYQEDPKLKDNDFIKSSEQIVKTAIILSTILSAIFDIICLKFRPACDYIIYFEIAHTIVLGFAP